MSCMQPSCISHQPLLIKQRLSPPTRLFWVVSFLLITSLSLCFISSSITALFLDLAVIGVLAVCAALILLGRRLVIVDEGQGRVTAVRNWHLFQRTAHYQLKDVTTITVTECVQSDNSRTTISYPIHLLLGDATAVHLQTTDTLEAAYQLAHPLANRWQVPIEEQYHLKP